MVTIEAFQTARGQNAREHHMVRSRRVKRERELVAWSLALQHAQRPCMPCVVLLTRVAPSRGLDDDNLVGSLKAVRDAVALWLGLDDADPRVAWSYAQERGDWAVRIGLEAR